ncbi:MAG: vitamin K epoxide reductase family protein [Prochlorococcus sp.]
MGSSRLTSRRRQDQGFKWARIAMAVLATVGLIDTGAITLNRWGWIGQLSCPGGNEACDKVLNSAWGSIFQGAIPLSLMGLLAYLAILIMAVMPLLPGLSENRAELSRRTWWGLFALSCGMAIFSLVLIGLMLFKIGAFCFFCALSACLSISLLILSLIGGGWDDLGQLIFSGVLLSLAVLLGGLIWASVVDPSRQEAVGDGRGMPAAVKTISSPSALALAEHLTKTGAVIYSAYWCPHCHDQKELFGEEGAAQLQVVECSEDGQNSQSSLCKRKGIDSYPTWEINGKLESGVKPLNKLADLSRYEGTRQF